MLTPALEWIGFLSGVACVWLMVKRNVATWPVGLVNSAAWLALLWIGQLYLNSLLQIAYLVLGVYGWVRWTRSDPDAPEAPLGIVRMPPAEWVLLAAFVVSLTAGLTWLMGTTDSVAPFWDSVTTVVSIAAMYLQATKRYEGWYLWIGVDVVYFALYASQDLYLTALTQIVFLAMCVLGLREWGTELKADEAVPQVT